MVSGFDMRRMVMQLPLGLLLAGFMDMDACCLLNGVFWLRRRAVPGFW